METTIHQLLWGSQADSESTSPLKVQESFGLLREHIQQALAADYPMPLVRAITVTQEARAVDGLICMGYSITVTLAIEQALATRDAELTLKCQIESLVSVALLDIFCPIHVDFVNTVPSASDSQ